MKLLVKPDIHQIDGSKFLLSKTKGILNFSTGSGKTIIVILSSFYLLSKTDINKVIIICTKSAVISFLDDFKINSDYIPLYIDSKEEFIDHLSNDSKEVLIIKYGLITDKLIIEEPNYNLGVVMTYLDPQIINLFKKQNITLFFDEYHTLKNPDAVVTKYVKELVPFVKRTYGLTATSFTRSLYDIYYLVNFMIPKYFGTKSDFVNAFICERDKTVNKGSIKTVFKEIFAYKNLEVLAELLKDIMLVYNSELNVTTKEILIDLEDIESYKEAALGLLKNKIDENALITDNEEVETVKNFSARLIDLQKVVDIDINKKRALFDLVLKLKHYGLVIFCDYHNSLEQVKEVLNSIPDIEVMVIDGSTSIQERKAIKDRFTKDPSFKIIPITPAGGQSLNLQATNHIIFYNCPYDPGKFTQIIGRIKRQYSKHDKFYAYILTVRDTIDEYKLTRLKAQINVMKQSLGLTLTDIVSNISFNSEILARLRQKFLWNSHLSKFTKVRKRDN